MHRALPIALCAGLACALAVLTALVPEEPAPVAAPLASDRPQWSEIVRPAALFSVEPSLLAKGTAFYSARRETPGGAREDNLAFGSFGGNEPYLRLVIRHSPEPDSALPTLFLDAARRAAQAGFGVERVGRAHETMSRLGPVELANASLSGEGRTRTGCTIFRLLADTPSLSISGLHCGADAEPVDMRQMGCLIGRIALANNADPALRRLFGKPDPARDAACEARLAQPKDKVQRVSR